MGDHTTDGPPEDTRRSTLVNGTLLGVDVAPLPLEGGVLVLVLDEEAGDVHLLTSDDNLLEKDGEKEKGGKRRFER